jgi:hypothetical protein
MSTKQGKAGELVLSEMRCISAKSQAQEKDIRKVHVEAINRQRSLQICSIELLTREVLTENRMEQAEPFQL